MQQNYEIAMKLTDVDVADLTTGDTVLIEAKSIDFTNGDFYSCLGYSFSFTYDTNYLNFIDFADVQDSLFPLYPSANYITNNSYDTVSIAWFNPTFCVVSVPENTSFFKFVFTYNGGLPVGDSSLIVWDSCSIIDEYFNIYNVLADNGSIYHKTLYISNYNNKDFFEIMPVNNNVISVINRTNSYAVLKIFDFSGRLFYTKNISPGTSVLRTNLLSNPLLFTVETKNVIVAKKLLIVN